MNYLFSLLLLIAFTGHLVAQNGSYQKVSYETEDRIKISASYQYPKSDTSTYPAIILIHQGGSSKQEWLDLPIMNRLLNEGYAVLAYDVRLHGDSGNDGEFADLYNNPNRAPQDLMATLAFLKKDSRIDADRIGIIGASIGANLACAASSSPDYQVKSVVVMSAKTSAAQNLSGQTEVLIPQNAFYIASESEQSGKRADWANELYDMTQGERKVTTASGDQHGSYILKDQPALEGEIIEWFKKTL